MTGRFSIEAGDFSQAKSSFYFFRSELSYCLLLSVKVKLVIGFISRKEEMQRKFYFLLSTMYKVQATREVSQGTKQKNIISWAFSSRTIL